MPFNNIREGGIRKNKFLFSLFQLQASLRNPNLVCKLKKAIYGTASDKLKQAPRAWFERWSSMYKSRNRSRGKEGAGFQRSQSDHSMFIRRSTSASGIVLLLVYVDYIAFSSNVMT